MVRLFAWIMSRKSKMQSHGSTCADDGEQTSQSAVDGSYIHNIHEVNPFGSLACKIGSFAWTARAGRETDA